MAENPVYDWVLCRWVPVEHAPRAVAAQLISSNVKGFF